MARRSNSPDAIALEVLTRAKATRLPVSLRNIARLYDVKIAEDSLEGGAAGYLLRDDGRALIVVNKRDSRARKRFTIAHELGHLLMHRGRPLLVDGDVRISERTASDFASTPEEREANQFAAALLMPEELVLREWEKVHPTPAAVAELAQRCEVSLSAMQFRLTNLGILMPPDVQPARRKSN